MMWLYPGAPRQKEALFMTLQQLAYLVVYEWQDVFLDNLLYDERHAGYDARLDFGE